MNSRIISPAILVALAIFALPAPAVAQEFKVSVVRDQEWIDLLKRTHGWTGGDGCLSIPLNGIEAPGLDAHPRTLFTFGDSIIGRVGENGRRLPGARMINNALLYVDGPEPDPALARFVYIRDDGEGNPASAFVPTVPGAEPDDFYWLMEGVAMGDEVHIFGFHLRPDPNEFWPVPQGIGMITIGRDDRPPFPDQQQRTVPLFVPAQGEHGPIVFPACIMSNTEEAGAPHPDGYVYVYGAREDPFIKKAIVARVLPERFTDFDAWRFWNGEDWVGEIEAVAPMTGRVAGLYSVVPMPDGRFLMVFQKDTMSPDIAVRIGDSPTGPWGPLRVIYTCPEPSFDPDIFTYNATAHPHLSKEGELLISYSVNSWNFEHAFWIAAAGRPRFIRLRIEE